MAEQYSLEAQSRTVIGKQVKALRRQDLIPAVIYGAGGNPIHISCPRRPLEIVLSKAGGTHLINVVVDGSTHNALVREVQRDKIRRTIVHVDFMRVDLLKKLRTEVPITLVDEPKLAGELQLTHNVTSVQVECLPGDIPDHLEISIRHLTTPGAQVTVGDLPHLPGVQILSDPHEIIARIDTQSASTVEEEVIEGAVAGSEPEVIEKGKKEEEEF